MPNKVIKIKKSLNKDIPLPELYVKNLFYTYTDDRFKEVNYCRADLTRHLMLLKAMECDLGNRPLRFEDLIDAIPANVCSRSHKVNCINDLCERGIFERTENPEDKRSTIIKPSKKTNDQYLRIFNFYKNTIKLFDFEQ
jgi:hypothetical protein